MGASDPVLHPHGHVVMSPSPLQTLLQMAPATSDQVTTSSCASPPCLQDPAPRPLPDNFFVTSRPASTSPTHLLHTSVRSSALGLLLLSPSSPLGGLTVKNHLCPDGLKSPAVLSPDLVFSVAHCPPNTIQQPAKTFLLSQGPGSQEESHQHPVASFHFQPLTISAYSTCGAINTWRPSSFDSQGAGCMDACISRTWLRGGEAPGCEDGAGEPHRAVGGVKPHSSGPWGV